MYSIYKDRKGEFRWRLSYRGRIIADSGEGYKRRAGAIAGIRRVRIMSAAKATVVLDTSGTVAVSNRKAVK